MAVLEENSEHNGWHRFGNVCLVKSWWGCFNRASSVMC